MINDGIEGDGDNDVNDYQMVMAVVHVMMIVDSNKDYDNDGNDDDQVFFLINKLSVEFQRKVGS